MGDDDVIDVDEPSSNCAEVVPPPRPRLIKSIQSIKPINLINPPPSAPTSPAFSVLGLSSQSSIGPPPSFIGSSSSAPPLSSPSQQLEISILRSQLEAARFLLDREQTRSREALEAKEAQFEQERAAYQAYIKTLEDRS